MTLFWTDWKRLCGKIFTYFLSTRKIELNFFLLNLAAERQMFVISFYTYKKSIYLDMCLSEI